MDDPLNKINCHFRVIESLIDNCQLNGICRDFSQLKVLFHLLSHPLHQINQNYYLIFNQMTPIQCVNFVMAFLWKIQFKQMYWLVCGWIIPQRSKGENGQIYLYQMEKLKKSSVKILDYWIENNVYCSTSMWGLAEHHNKKGKHKRAFPKLKN